MAPRIILGTQLIGKSFAHNNFLNVFDVDQTKQYLLKGGTTSYFKYLETVINNNEYDIIFGWLNKEIVDYLIDKNYKFEIIISNDSDIIKKRAEKVNISTFNTNVIIANNIKNYELFKTYKNKTKVFEFIGNVKITEFLKRTGSELKPKFGFRNELVSDEKAIIKELLPDDSEKLY